MILRITQKYRYKDGRPKPFYGCSNFPKCRATHGAHPDGAPLGTPGDKPTKEARIEAHNALEMVSNKYGWSRNQAYTWLRGVLGITRDQCHMGKFSAEQCRRVVAACVQFGR